MSIRALRTLRIRAAEMTTRMMKAGMRDTRVKPEGLLRPINIP